MSCLRCAGTRKIPIVGACLLPGQQGPDDLHTHVQAAFGQCPSNRHAPAFMGDFNVDLDCNDPNCAALKATGLLSCLQMKIASFRMKLK